MKIAVRDRYPASRHGIELALSEAGYVVEQPLDLGRWAEAPGPRALVLGCSTQEEARDLALLRRRGMDVVAVAVIGDGSAIGYREALETGVDSAVARDASLERIVEVVRAALDRRTVLPSDVARDLARRDSQEGIDARQTGWLRWLSRGMTVEELADRAGYSERAMYRQLRRLYERLGAANRTEALLQAMRRGLID